MLYFQRIPAITGLTLSSELLAIGSLPTDSDKQTREILGTSKISYRYQITIPKDVRDRFHLDEGDIIVFIDESNRLVMRKSTQV